MSGSAIRILIALCSALAAAGPASSRSIDQARIHAEYNDGEFEKVALSLERHLKSGRSCSRSDSLFAAKHLAVVYAANPATRELGRYHMFRLLEMAPGSDLLDMFVGEEVGAVFEKVRRENGFRKDGAIAPRAATPALLPAEPPAGAAAADKTPAPPAAPDTLPTDEDANASGPAWKDPGVWIGGGAALAVVAFTFFYAGSEPEAAPKTYVVPAAAASR